MLIQELARQDHI